MPTYDSLPQFVAGTRELVFWRSFLGLGFCRIHELTLAGWWLS